MLGIGSAHLFPSADRLAYVFKPASADLATLLLVVALLWALATASAITSAFAVIGLVLHVGYTWLAHNQNVAKLRAKEELMSSLAAQKSLLQVRMFDHAWTCLHAGASLANPGTCAWLQIKHDKLNSMVGDVAQLKANIAIKETQTAELHTLQSQHDRLEQRVAAMDRMQAAIQAGQGKTAQLPKLQVCYCSTAHVSCTATVPSLEVLTGLAHPCTKTHRSPVFFIAITLHPCACRSSWCT